MAPGPRAKATVLLAQGSSGKSPAVELAEDPSRGTLQGQVWGCPRCEDSPDRHLGPGREPGGACVEGTDSVRSPGSAGTFWRCVQSSSHPCGTPGSPNPVPARRCSARPGGTPAPVARRAQRPAQQSLPRGPTQANVTGAEKRNAQPARTARAREHFPKVSGARCPADPGPGTAGNGWGRLAAARWSPVRGLGRL